MLPEQNQLTPRPQTTQPTEVNPADANPQQNKSKKRLLKYCCLGVFASPLVLVALIVLFFTLGPFVTKLFIPISNFISDIGFVKEQLVPETKTTLTLLDNSQIKSLHDVVDQAESLSEFESNYYNRFYDLTGLASSPEIIASKLESASVGGIDPLAEIAPKYLEEADLPELKKFAHLFTDEYTKYPVEWMENVNPFGFVFVKSVAIRDVAEVAGVTTQFVVYSIGSKDELFTRRLIHHELSHFMDHRFFFDIKGNRGLGKNWPTTVNNYNNKYDLTSTLNNVEYPTPGFVTGYAKTNLPEDKAEVYSYLFTKDGYTKLKKWTADDEILKKKVDFLKSFIKGKVEGMDEAYFEEYILNNTQ